MHAQKHNIPFSSGPLEIKCIPFRSEYHPLFQMNQSPPQDQNIPLLDSPAIVCDPLTSLRRGVVSTGGGAFLLVDTTLCGGGVRFDLEEGVQLIRSRDHTLLGEGCILISRRPGIYIIWSIGPSSNTVTVLLTLSTPIIFYLQEYWKPSLCPRVIHGHFFVHYKYRIARIFGGKLNLAFWWSILQLPN